MSRVYVLIGIAALVVIVGGWYAFNQKSTTPDYAGARGPSESMTLSITSTAFQDGTNIPSQYTCDAENVSPPLQIVGVPDGTISLALLVDDPDIPQVFKDQRGIDSFDHWTLFNIPPATTEIPQAGSAGVAGVNGSGESAYTGPCPPPEYEPSEHRYFFKLYALDTMLDLAPGASKTAVLEAMQGHVLAEAELMGRYKRIAK